MPDPTTILAAGVGTYALEKLGGKELIVKLFGPTADYLGKDIAISVETGKRNLMYIFSKAAKKLGNKINNPGVIPPKVLKSVYNAGIVCDDELHAEYLSGVLASSRTEGGRDDRGSFYINLLSHLSTYQVRLHYVFYSFLKKQFDGIGISPATPAVQKKLSTYFPVSTYRFVMEFDPNEDQYSILTDSLAGLKKESLIGPYRQGNKDLMMYAFPEYDFFESYGIVLIPTILGFNLFLWAMAAKGITHTRFFEKDVEIQPIQGIRVPKKVFPFANNDIDEWASEHKKRANVEKDFYAEE